MLTMVLIFVVGTFGLNFQITTALMAKQVFHRGATGYGLLSTALAVGACVGAVLATRRARRGRPSCSCSARRSSFSAARDRRPALMPSFCSPRSLLVPTGLAMLTLTTAANSLGAARRRARPCAAG